MPTVSPRRVLNTYVTITLLSTFASAFIWGINTLFLLGAGLSITEAFAANAFFTLGQAIFEIPTGVVADSLGRRASFLMGAITLIIGTALYWLLWKWQSPFVYWALSSMLLGLGFTFFSGATEAWLVDALNHAGYQGSLENAFARGQVASGVAMLAGTFSGGYLAQQFDLGLPYLLRTAFLAAALVVAALLMQDHGFAARSHSSMLQAMRHIIHESIEQGLRNAALRPVMLAGPFVMGVAIFGFYAMQPYLLQLYGRAEAYAIAGLAATMISAAQIGGGLLTPWIRKLFRLRSSVLLAGTLCSSLALLLMGLWENFYGVLATIAVWASLFAATMPVRQAYLNQLIPSAQRATVLSSDNLLSSLGGIVFQPVLGGAAQRWGYASAYVLAAMASLLAFPFYLAVRRSASPADQIDAPSS
ncbi:MAG: MFS transporter [Leptospirales bacterium]|nr:MFS transporter [Leptospirales bacterium]